MTKKDMKLIDEMVAEENECGYLACDFDDERHDARIIAEALDTNNEQRIKEALNYYYSLH